MTQYRRKAGAPVQVWRVGDGEPPEWASPDLFPTLVPADGRFVIIRRASGWTMLNAEAFERDYEPLPTPAPDARNCTCNLRTRLVGDGCDVCNPDLAGTVAPAPDAREALEIAKAALERIAVYGCGMLNQPAEMNGPHVAWLKQRIAAYEQEAREALARIGGGWTPTHRHYKGGRYRELYRGKQESDLSPVVVYQAQDGTIWTRLAIDFDETMPDGTPRFTRIGGGA